MWVVHWLLGMAFYLALGVACWIEGAGMSSSYYQDLIFGKFYVRERGRHQ